MTTQLETFRDIDLEAFTLEMRNKAGINVIESISDATIRRTMEGASTLTVTCEDDNERTIQKSSKLGRKVDVNVDGLWFTLVALKKNQRQMTLTFEDRVVNALRYYDSWKFVSRGVMTRAQFVLWMILEVKEFPVHYVIPELNKKTITSDVLPGETLIDPTGKPVTTSSPEARPGGIPRALKLTVKSGAATNEQISNGETIIGTGVKLGARRKLLVCSIMTAIQESEIKNLQGQPKGGHMINVGIFQQDSRYWPASRDIARDAAAFFNSAINLDKINPNLSYNDLCQAVQHSAFPYAYGPHQAEAEAWVTAYGETGTGLNGTGDVTENPATANNQKTTPASFSSAATGITSGDYQFYRGNLTQDPDGSGNFILKKRNSWDTMQVLAQEVNWKAFCVSGYVYFISQQYLFRSKPFMVISEDSDGIDWIDYDYDEGKRVATITVTCHIHRWSAPPGSIVQIVDMGIPNGKWLVNDVSRSLYNTIGTVILKKPDPILPEPTVQSQAKQFPFGALTSAPTPNAPIPVTPPIAGARTNPGAGEVSPTGAALQIVTYAKKQLGLPYVWATEVPGVSFDCSGLTQAAYSSAGITIPRNAQLQYDAGPVIFDTLQPGDIVFFDSERVPPRRDHVGHCGIYIGGGNFIHAPHTGDFVKISSLSSGWYHDHYVGATRAWT